ncbi:MAG: methionine ABC transporter ATP-binding protein [Lachnospiraceae bacterium]|nr:methionine ABC transporter ATP-binding protein [Lachnospiraceae bacterium]
MSDAFIEIRDLKKTFRNKKETVEVLKGINLEVQKGEIYGVVGFSGAGKSTLVRCINMLEKPDSGLIRIGSQVITELSKSELKKQRTKIGMIFQQFNLFDSKTVYQNIAYPLRVCGWKKAEIDSRVDELLELVDLKDKKNAYPGQLSGGQKQRVGIARALANKPDVLLCDEATSALDPQTTISVLNLIREINQKLGLTIILITHELEVIRYTCNQVAVMEDGEFREKGAVRDLFENPKSNTAKNFIEVYNLMRSEAPKGGDPS